jgi:HPt (histidine-containing phosphotransfer) domain-containing protein
LIAGGDDQLVRELSELFREDCETNLAGIRSGIVENDSTAVAFAAHALKGSASSLSASRVAAAAEALEALGRIGTIDGADVMLRKLEDEIQQLLARLPAEDVGVRS